MDSQSNLPQQPLTNSPDNTALNQVQAAAQQPNVSLQQPLPTSSSTETLGSVSAPTGLPTETPPAGQVFGMTGQPLAPGQPVAGRPAPKKRGKLKALLLVLLGVGILGGGSAAAYYGYVVPNKPENVLKAAVKNTLNQKSVTAKTTFEGKNSGVAYKGTITTKSNSDKKVLGLDANMTISGFTVTAEARYVDDSAFVKIGDLSSITDIIGAANADYSTLIKQLNSKVTGQWFEIDSTLLKQANMDCVLGNDLSFSEADYQILADAYTKNTFVTINSTTKETLNGKSATKFQLTLNGKKAEAFGTSIEKTSLFKKLSQCLETSTSSDTSPLDKDITDTVKSATSQPENVPFSLWVDPKAKTISRLVIETTAAEEKAGTSGSLDTSFDYSPVSVEKPSGSKPITTLVSEVMKLYQDQPVLGAQIERLIP